MPLKPKYDLKKFLPARRKFTDREGAIAAFHELLDSDRKIRVLHFYGLPGIGKSRLQQHLIDEFLNKRNDVIFARVDFELESNRRPVRALRVLAEQFQRNFKVNFNAFTVAFHIYRGTEDPDFIKKEKKLPFIEEGSVLGDILSAFDSGVAGTILGIADYLYQKIPQLISKELKQQLTQLTLLQPHEIEARLPLFFAHDLKKYLAENKNHRCVIFLDTHEALWTKKTAGNIYSRDEWLREMILQLERVLFVISGRERLRWHEIDSDWGERIDQYLVGALAESDARDFLASCAITDKPIADCMIAGSTGVPFYLDLCVDLYHQLEQPTAEDF